MMRPQPILLLVALCLALSGCTQGRPPEEPVPEPVTPPVPSETAKNPPDGAELPVQPVPGSMKRVMLPSPEAIKALGAYSFHLNSGEVESWQFTELTSNHVAFAYGGRWVTGQAGSKSYWTNRQSGESFAFDVEAVRVLAEAAGRILLVGVGANQGHLWVTDEHFKPLLALDLGQASLDDARFSPDGKNVAMKRSGGTGPGSPGQRIDVLEVGSGTIRSLAAEPEGPLAWSQFIESPLTSDLLVQYVMKETGPMGLTTGQTYLHRYDWQGALKERRTLSGPIAVISPDGKRMAVTQNLSDLTNATQVVETATGRAHLRVDWAYPLQWFADSSTLLLHSNTEYWMLSEAGVLTKAPRLPMTAVGLPQLQPSPTNPDQLAAGLAVVDRTGKLLHEIQVPVKEEWMAGNVAWAPSGMEVLFTISQRYGKDGDYGDWMFALPPRVERPPFQDPFFLQVKDHKGECVNLRERPSKAGAVSRCLPTGTKLAVADRSKASMELRYSPLLMEEDEVWLWVRTEKGEMGFVAVSTGSVNWAD